MNEVRDPEPHGWDAITAAFESLYPDQSNPVHMAPPLPPGFSGDGLIYGISAYRATDPNHWHLVTYGFSELYEKESDDPEVSGWGFELTMRLPRTEAESHPPHWVFDFLMNLGRYVARSHNPFGVGHHMDLNGPISLGSDTAIKAIAFVADPTVLGIDTPNGRVEFLQVVGTAIDEYEACGDWTTSAVLDVLKQRDPLLITDLERKSMLSDPRFADLVENGIAREGSSSDRSFFAHVQWSVDSSNELALSLGARAVEGLLRKLKSRLLHGRNHMLCGKTQWIGFAVADQCSWKISEEDLRIDLSGDGILDLLENLKPSRGVYTFRTFPGLRISVVPSEITDPEGKVIRVIG